MILHLITDDKFADYAINQFTMIDASSQFLLVKSAKNETIQNIKNVEKIIQLTAHSEEYYALLKRLNSYTAVIIHGLFYSWQEEIVLSVPKNTKIAWVCWGGEIYGRRQLLQYFLKNKTKYVYRNKQVKRFLKSKPLLGNEYFTDLSTYKKINYCLSDMQEEYQFVKKFTNSDMKYLWYNYYSIEETLGGLKQNKINGINIMVGNSCSLENNHLDAFKILRRFRIIDRKIIVPLSYGAEWLRNIILKRGTYLFGAIFLPLTDFLDRNEYNKLISSCSIMIMPHLRPQAQGNIITGLWLGAKVYLSNKSLTYYYFKGLGICIFSIEDDLKPTNKLALQALEYVKMEQNREILMREYGRENMMVRIREIVRVLNN